MADLQRRLRETATDWLLRLQAAPDDAGLRADFEAWRDASPAHAAAFGKAERVWRLTGQLPPAELAPRRRAPRLWLAAGALAASLILALLAPKLWLQLQADHLTGIGETRQVSLADGSRISLNADSAVAIRITAARREVTLLSGEAFFEVAPDAQRPFTVQADAVRVTVTGTAFDVRLGADSVAVAVRNGAVRVGSGDGPQAALAPGEQLRIDRHSGAALREAIAPARIAAWRDGQLVVEGASIGQVVEELRRHHPGLILLRDDALAQSAVTGVYSLSDPAAALRAVVQPHRGQVRALTPYLLIVTGP